MKKNLAKIFASASIVVAIILIVILLVTAFGGITAKDFDSKAFKGILVTLGCLYGALSAITLALLFSNTNTVKEVVIHQGRKGSLRVSAKAIDKIVKEVTNGIEGVKCKKVVLLTDDYGTRLKVSLKVVDRDAFEVETAARIMLEDRFLNQFGLVFSSIEIKLMQFNAKYEADKAELDAKIEERMAEIKKEYAEEDAAAEAAEQVEQAAPAVEEVADAAVEEAKEEAVDEVAQEAVEEHVDEVEEAVQEAVEEEAAQEVAEEEAVEQEDKE